MVAQPHLIEQLIKVKDSYNCDALSIAAATAAIGDRHGWPRTGQDHRHTAAACEGNADIRVCNGRFAGQFHLELPCPAVRSRPFYEELKRRRILVRYMDYPGWGDGLRISVGTDARNQRPPGSTKNVGLNNLVRQIL